jgi:hypothetical protein
MSRNFQANTPCSNHDNQGDDRDLCRYCDAELIAIEAEVLTVDKYGDEYTQNQYDEVYSELYSSCTLCYSCNKDEIADFRDDY